ncbi:MAG: TRAP transporter large permease subunit [Rhodopseudomonas sp.]|nr:TRAP transporter large permease subunit [Rhodopseudomonas sp.]
MGAGAVGLTGMAALIVLIFLRVPVGVAMGLVGFFGYAAIDGWGRALSVLGQAPYDVATGYTLTVVPLFIVMGDLALRAGMSAKLYDASRSLFFGVRGAQAYATLGACAGFGAICGSSLATAATMTRIAVPQMRKAGYDDRLSTGAVAAGGSLGILIPPSIPFVVYALTTQESVPRLFAAGMIPGLLLTALYMLVAFAVTKVRPDWAPRQEAQQGGARLREIAAVWDVVLLFAVTIGGLYLGWFTPTEAAAVGAFGALALGALGGGLSFSGALESFRAAIKTTCMLFVIVICAVIFSYFVVQAQLPGLLVAWTQSLHLPPLGLICILIVFYILLGCFMDGLGMILITVPVFLPLVVASGYDPIWFGVMLVVLIELGLIHPPVGMNIFIIQGQVPDVPVLRIYQGIVPFLAAPFLLLVLLIAFPQIALWLPGLLFQ